jgi:hypothetical protein
MHDPVGVPYEGWSSRSIIRLDKRIRLKFSHDLNWFASGTPHWTTPCPISHHDYDRQNRRIRKIPFHPWRDAQPASMWRCVSQFCRLPEERRVRLRFRSSYKDHVTSCSQGRLKWVIPFLRDPQVYKPNTWMLDWSDGIVLISAPLRPRARDNPTVGDSWHC